jgi:hypothetical protein
MKINKHRKIVTILLVGVLFVSFGLLSYDAKIFSEEAQKGIVTFVSGSVKKQTEEIPNWTRAEKDTEVLTGDKVRTYKDSRAELELLEMDVIRMAPQTTLDVLKLYAETREKRREVKLHVEQGDIWAKIDNKEGKAKFDISTPITVAAITGTTLRLTANSDSTSRLKVYQGEVQITNAPQNTQLQPQSIQPYEIQGPHQIPGPYEVSVQEWLYIVKSMQQITVNKQGQVVNVGEFSSNDLDEKTDWVKWNKARDRFR